LKENVRGRQERAQRRRKHDLDGERQTDGPPHFYCLADNVKVAVARRLGEFGPFPAARDKVKGILLYLNLAF
jgi:hypothetical protein